MGDGDGATGDENATISVYARVLPSTELSDFLSIDLTVAAGPNERGLVFVPPTLRAPPRNPYAATKRARLHSWVGRRLPEAGIARLLLQT